MEFIIGNIKISSRITPGEKDFPRLFKAHFDVMSLSDFIKDLQVHPEWREEIRKTEFARAVHGTLAIEGSVIGIDDIEHMMEEHTLPTDEDNARKEVSNALAAYEFIVEWSGMNQGKEITDSVIRQIHTVLTRDIDYYLNEPGKYRDQPVSFGSPRKDSILRNAFEVKEAMAQIIRFINFKDDDVLSLGCFPVTRAIMTHYLITLVHPFIDGNGRVARAVEALILHHYGKFEPYCFPISARYYYEKRLRYFELLRKADETGELIPFTLFAIDGLIQHLSSIKKQLLDQITRTLIIDYLWQLKRTDQILKRHITFMEIAFGLGKKEAKDFWRQPAIRGLYQNLSESTRKRDFARLLELNLLKTEKVSLDGRSIEVISVNWDVLKTLRLRLDKVPHRPR
jgi:Fic family protein